MGTTATFCVLGTFAEWQVYDQLSCVKVDPDLPLDAACLVACGVQTGLGSATSAARSAWATSSWWSASAGSA